MIQVLLVDDHTLVRAGLQRVLELAGDMRITIAQNGEEAVSKAGSAAFDVVLMDVSMPGIGGIEAARQIVESGSSAAVIILTASTDRDDVVGALRAGAVGYLVKDADPADLVEGVRAATRGESPLDSRAARMMLENRDAVEAQAPQTPQTCGLTARETEVLDLVAEGLANKQIARRLGISEKTVKAHLTRIFSQIGVSDRTQAALWVVAHRR